MTVGISNVAIAGSVQVAQAATGVEVKQRLPESHASMPKGAEGAFASPTPSSLSSKQSQALARVESQQHAAVTVRHAKETFGRIEALLGQIENHLQQIVKQYPPYPLESQERMELLNSLAGLRKQIDALTFPPPDREPITLIGDPAGREGAGDMQFTLGDETYTLHAQPAHSGSGGLDIPALSNQASDAEVGEALSQVRLAQERLAERKAALAEELEAILMPRTDQVDAALQASRDGLTGQSVPISNWVGGLDKIQ